MDGTFNASELAPAVLAFLRENVHTLEHLELLALMVKMPDRWWDATSASQALHLSVTATGAALEHLASHNLLEISLTTDVRYRLQPGTPTLGSYCEAFARAYRTNPLAIARYVTDTHQRAIQEFADAFRVRGHDDR
jgi:hypothetical protein